MDNKILMIRNKAFLPVFLQHFVLVIQYRIRGLFSLYDLIDFFKDMWYVSFYIFPASINLFHTFSHDRFLRKWRNSLNHILRLLMTFYKCRSNIISEGEVLINLSMHDFPEARHISHLNSTLNTCTLKPSLKLLPIVYFLWWIYIYVGALDKTKNCSTSALSVLKFLPVETF